MSDPKRVQLSRKKGWRMSPNTVKVDRSTKWGNPYQAGADGDGDRSYLVALFRQHLGRPEGRGVALRAREELRGKNLACWCPLDQPCHADVLLELANGPEGAARPNGRPSSCEESQAGGCPRPAPEGAHKS